MQRKIYKLHIIRELNKSENRELYQEGKGCHYLVYENDSVIACGGAIIKEDVPFCFFKTPIYGYIVDVYCIPEKRRNGYSSKIMDELIKWLRNNDVHNIKLKPSLKSECVVMDVGNNILEIKNIATVPECEEFVDVKKWYELANVRAYYEFFKKHEKEFIE